MKSFAVIGLGRFGSRLATSLYESGADVLAIDIHESCVDKIGDNVTQAVAADASDIAILRKLGVDSCDYVIVAVGSNLGVSTLVTMNLTELGVENIICKASNPTHKAILEKLGAKRVFIPEQEFADRLALNLIKSDKNGKRTAKAFRFNRFHSCSVVCDIDYHIVAVGILYGLLVLHLCVGAA